MTYNMFGGTLNLIQSNLCCCQSWVQKFRGSTRRCFVLRNEYILQCISSSKTCSPAMLDAVGWQLKLQKLIPSPLCIVLLALVYW